MATNGLYQRQGFVKGKSRNKMNHFLGKGNALDPVSVDLQKKHLMECPTENSLRKNLGEQRERQQRSDRCRHASTPGDAKQPQPLRPGVKAENCGIGGHQQGMTEIRQEISSTLPTELRECCKGQNWGFQGPREETSTRVTHTMV